ncbi:hypothetical protein, partial [Pseudarthrobacter sulfonivorans]|uniref:hypothetical protein n=1 Tax=Pseudarthrobacter sulfonivorans TaxID=121292 RepID=UPI0027D92969
TLLSSQTTDTPGTTTSTKQPWIAPEQLFKLTRFLAAMQIHLSGPASAENTFSTQSEALERTTRIWS